MVVITFSVYSSRASTPVLIPQELSGDILRESSGMASSLLKDLHLEVMYQVMTHHPHRSHKLFRGGRVSQI
jgi:hypothetical protein